MERSVLTTRTWLLLIGAALLLVAGALNFGQRLRRDTPPWDGVTWVDTSQGIVAESVGAESAAGQAHLLPGDRLIAVSVNDAKYDEVVRARDVQMYLDQSHVGGEVHYLIERPSYPEESRFYYADLNNLGSIHNWTPRDIYINLIGIVYLLVGFFVLFKQGGRAPFALHFATLCLAAFVFHFYTPVGSYRDLDLAIAFLDSAALIFFPPLFVHFCALYPTKQQLFTKRSRAIVLYVPALMLLTFAALILLRDVVTPVVPFLGRVPAFSESFVSLFYKLSLAHFVMGLAAGALLLVKTSWSAKNAVVRQQMKWVIWGLVLATAPFTALYAVASTLR